MHAGSPSFPSGHTSDAFATATSLSIAFPKWYVIAPSFLWACSVGYSRMDLGVHYPSDVMAGAIIGAGSAYLCYKANRWIQKRRR
jgi:membrane-associated phospholipid phosphatase